MKSRIVEIKPEFFPLPDSTSFLILEGKGKMEPLRRAGLRSQKTGMVFEQGYISDKQIIEFNKKMPTPPKDTVDAIPMKWVALD